MKKMTPWAMIGSVVVNVMLGLAIAAVFSAAPSANASEAQSPDRHAAAPAHPPAPAAPAAPGHKSYLTAVRMGWA
jgi:hypothetical protein